MVSIQMTLSQKLQVGFIALVLMIAGFLFFRSTRASVDATVNAWEEKRQEGINPKYRISSTNPVDPKRERVVYVFACFDGRLKITTYSADPDRVLLTFEASQRQALGEGSGTFGFFLDPVAQAKTIADPYKHALALSAYNAANGRLLGLMGPLGLTAEQVTAEGDARTAMQLAVGKIDEDAAQGVFHSEMFDKIKAALDRYRSLSGAASPSYATYNPKKADAARDVIQYAADYLRKITDEKSKVIAKYMSAIDGMLNADQKQRLADSGKAYEQRQMAGGAGGARGARRNPVVAGAGGPGMRAGGGGRGATQPAGGRGRVATAPAGG